MAPHHAPPSLPSPPSTDNDATTKPSKRPKTSKQQPGPRGPKRAAAATKSPELGLGLGLGGDGRHKRVWKACERCRMKKTKCDGESPCKRCKDDGLVCTAGSRKKAEFKQLPRGYAEVLENTQYALIATVHKLYAMVRTGEPWTLPEPTLNARGQPVIHDIASKLGCIRADPSSSAFSTPLAEFPADATEFAALQRRLESEERGFNGLGASGDIGAAESQFGDDSFCGDFGDGSGGGVDFDDEFADVTGNYGDLSPTFDDPSGATSSFAMEGLLEAQLQLQQQRLYDDFLPSPPSHSSPSTSSSSIPAQVQAQAQMRLPRQLQPHLPLASQPQIQLHRAQQRRQQPGSSWSPTSTTGAGGGGMTIDDEARMRMLMLQAGQGGMYTGIGVGGGVGGVGGMGGDGTIRPNLLECGFSGGSGHF